MIDSVLWIKLEPKFQISRQDSDPFSAQLSVNKKKKQ